MATDHDGPSALELRLYAVALLAAIYTISWRAIGGHAPAGEPAAPVNSLPATTDGASERRQPRLAPVPVHRAPRVRTRSS